MSLDDQLWLNYANVIKDQMIKSQPLGDKNKMFIPPLNTQTLLAGEDIDSAMTNAGIARIGNGLIDPSNPMLTFSEDGYVQQCLKYVRAVKLDGRAEGGLEDVAKDKYKQMNEDQANFLKERKAAGAAFKDDEFKDPSLTFDQWTQQFYPVYFQALQKKDGSAQAYDQIMTQINGQGWQTLASLRKRLEAAEDPMVGTTYNMEVARYRLGEKAPTTTGKAYAPVYSLSGNYGKTVKDWKEKAAQTNPSYVTLNIDTSKKENQSWQSVGHSTTSGQGSVSAPFFTIRYTYNNEHKEEHIKIDDSSSEVTIKLKMITAPQTFEIQPDSSWAPGNLRNQFRNVDKEQPGLLKPMYRISQILVGYNVSQEVTMSESLFKKVSDKISDVTRQDAGATASLFGFRINLGGSVDRTEENATDFSNVKQTSDGRGYIIPGGNTSIPVLLGAIGTEVWPAA